MTEPPEAQVVKINDNIMGYKRFMANQTERFVSPDIKTAASSSMGMPSHGGRMLTNHSGA